jgi:glutaredoxin|tara:strand:+ start:780 stop:953 length:174 start_codon:yes stop_codon:yes gene_type:complete
MAKDLMREHHIKFCEVNITNSMEAKRKLKESGYKTVPQIFNGKHLVGGYAELKESLS